MNALKRIEKLEQEVKRLKQRATVGGGGMPASSHASSHSSGGSDEIDVTDLGGFPGDPSLVLLGDGTFGSAVESGGQFIHVPTGDGRMVLTGAGHPVLLFWDGP
jgi:hypothetical protein